MTTTTTVTLLKAMLALRNESSDSDTYHCEGYDVGCDDEAMGSDNHGSREMGDTSDGDEKYEALVLVMVAAYTGSLRV